jgi:L-lactate dehydrogenase complex protein LldF
MDVESPKYFKENVRNSCRDAKLRAIVKKATTHSLLKRQEVVDEVDNWEGLRQQGYEIRKEAVNNLERYLSEFQKSAEKNSIRIFHAKNAKDAKDFVIKILKDENAKLVVKSKSMVTEELHLNDAILQNGIEAVETDLGEYIVQLAGETPSHITAPALHKSREEIGKLFSEKLGLKYTSDPAELTQYARTFLRKKFLKADVGISGANFLVAETGTIVLVENEGNARLSTTLPKIHIVVTGIEKVVPTLQDAAVLLKLLPRSATGQKATSYVSFINSTRRPGELDGPEKIYVVLLDNGRKEIQGKPEAIESLYCIKCGACMNVCPVYQTVSGHAYGSVYPGPIGSILTPMMNSLKEAKDLPFGSSLCGACSEICPVKINIHHTLLWLRSQSVKRGFTPKVEKVIFYLWRLLMLNPKLYFLASKAGRFMQPLFMEDKAQRKVAMRSVKNELPKFAEKSFREIWREGLDAKSDRSKVESPVSKVYRNGNL